MASVQKKVVQKAGKQKKEDALSAKAKVEAGGYVYPVGFKPPKNLAAAADLYYSTKEARLEKAKAVEALQEQEIALKNYLLASIPADLAASGIAGKTCRVQLVKKDVPRVESWPQVYASIVDSYKKHLRQKDGMEDAAFALLQRRLGDATVRELWNEGRTVDGVGKFTVVDLSVSKL